MRLETLYLLHFSPSLSNCNMLRSILRSKETAAYAKTFKPAEQKVKSVEGKKRKMNLQ